MPDRILRLQHVEVRVPDLELCAAYYTEVLGLVETARDVRDGVERVFLKCWDEHEHHSVVLRAGTHLRAGPHGVQGGRGGRPGLLHREAAGGERAGEAVRGP